MEIILSPRHCERSEAIQRRASARHMTLLRGRRRATGLPRRPNGLLAMTWFFNRKSVFMDELYEGQRT